MRRYFYLLLFLFSMSLFSQDVNEEIVGEWKVTKMYSPFICDFGRKIPEYYIVFTELGLLYDIPPKINGKRNKSWKCRWRVNNEELIELISETDEIIIEYKLRLLEDNSYCLYNKTYRIFIEKVED